jgi:hypothetical protein
MDAGPVADRFDYAGDFLTRDKRQGQPRETAAEEIDIPLADTRTVDSDQRLARRWSRVWQFTEFDAADPTQ